MVYSNIRKSLFIFVVGISVGAITSRLLFDREIVEKAPEMELNESVISTTELDLANEKIADLEMAKHDLQEQVDLLSKQQEKPITQTISLGSGGLTQAMKLDPEKAASFHKSIEASMKRFIDTRVAQMAHRLNLSEEQKDTFLDILKLQHEQRQIMFLKKSQGESEAGNIGAISQSEVEELMKATLDDVQKEEYEELLQEERKSRNEMMATAQLSQMAPMLGVDEEQKDAMYGLLYSEADQMAAGAGRDERESLREQTDVQMAEILTPEQLEQYKTFRNSPRSNATSSGAVILAR